MVTNNSRINGGECGQSFSRIHNGDCSKTGFQRISQGYCTGNGDGGYSQVTAGGELFSKADDASQFYGAVEEAQQAIAELLNNHRIALKIGDILLDGESLGEQLEVTPLLQPDVIEFLDWLQQALFSLNSYCYSATDATVNVPTRHAFPDAFHAYVDKQTEAWKRYAPSREFQFFGHRNMTALNKIRIAIRKVERDYSAWAQSTRIVEAMTQRPALAVSIRRHNATLNRLSNYFWNSIGREYALSGKEKQYWGGRMPAFSQEVLTD